MARHQFALIACARWETRYITEWLLYHRSIGFDHVYLYCNDDDPRELYAEVLPFLGAENPFVTFRHYPLQGRQREMYQHFFANGRDAAEWIMFLDVDEFVCLRGLNDIARFVAPRSAECDAIYFNWLYFGDNRFEERPAGSVLLQYRRREPVVNPYTKVLIRNAAIAGGNLESAFWHNWIEALGPQLRACNVLGHPMQDYYREFPTAAWEYLRSDDVTQRILETAQIFHFAFKARNDHEFRTARGMLGDFHRQNTWSELAADGRLNAFLEGANSVEDNYLRDYWQQFLDQANATTIDPA